MSDFVARARDIFFKYTQDKNLRNTKQRENILDVFLRTDKHLTAEELYEIVKKKYSKTGFATVYRTLRMMSDCNLADEIKVGSDRARFEHKFGHEHHDHLICIKCGRFIEIRNQKIEKLQEKIAKKNGFMSQRHKLEIYGLCKNCRK